MPLSTTRLLALLGTVAFLTGLLAPALAEVTTARKVVVAWASWPLGEVEDGRWKTINIEVRERETADGEVLTTIDVSKMRCHLDGPWTICGRYRSAKIHKVVFTYDTLFTTARAKMVTASGEAWKVRWEVRDPVPAGVATSQQVCGSGTGKGARAIKFASAKGSLFGRRLGATAENDADVSFGAESTEC